MEKTIKALMQAILFKSFNKEILNDDKNLIEAAMTLSGKISAMPIILHFGITVLTKVFSAYVVCTTGKFFHCHDIPTRLRLVSKWCNSPVGPCREFVNFYEKMTVFIYLSLCQIKN